MGPKQQTIGLIGIGLVGTVLAEHILGCVETVIGFDIDQQACERIRRLGGRVANSPREVAACVDCLLLSLPDAKVVRQVIEGPDGVLEAERIPPYLIDTTTGDPRQTALLAAELGRRGSALLDATKVFYPGQLRRRQAVLMVGGARPAFDACAELLGVLAERVFYMGPSGSGAKSKLATNLVLGLNRLVLAEGMVFAEKLGLDLGSFLQVLRAGPAYSVAVDVKGDKMLKGDFTAESRMRQHHKDVSLMLECAADQGQDLPLSRVHLDILAGGIGAGDGELDTSAVIKEVKRRRAKQKPS